MADNDRMPWAYDAKIMMDQFVEFPLVRKNQAKGFIVHCNADVHAIPMGCLGVGTMAY